jgi:hypothetical protein
MTSNCSSGICAGLVLGENCASNEDCSAGLYCQTNLTVWPYRTKCENLLAIDQPCISHEECKLHLFCGFASSSDKVLNKRVCREKNFLSASSDFGWDDQVFGSFPDKSISLELYNGLSC